MKASETMKRKQEIVTEINLCLQREYDAAMDAAFGVEYREDNPDLPDPTPEELAELEAKAEAARREIEEQDYEGKIHALLDEYAALNGGEWPYYNPATDMWE